MNRKRDLNVKVKRALIVMMSVCVPIVAVGADAHPDAWITTQARSVLQLAEGARASEVNVDTSNGRVTLHGKVPSAKDKAVAAEEVRRVAGVLEVRNLLQVVAPGNRKWVQRSDNAVRTDVSRALRTDRSLDDSRITVRSVSNGVVLLGGIAASSNDNVRALGLTARRPGVRRVYSEIESLDATAAPSVAASVRIPAAVVPPARYAPVTAVDRDDEIRRGVERALGDIDGQDNSDINVRVSDGVVWLTGSVPTWQGNSSRVYATRSVTGVRSIVNRMHVVAVNDYRR